MSPRPIASLPRVNASRRVPAGFSRRPVVAVLTLVAAALTASPVYAADEMNPDSAENSSEERQSVPDDAEPFPPPPVGVRLGEALESGRFRLAYSWERIRAQGLRARDDDLTPADVRALGFMQTPRALEITIHTFQIAYAPHPRVTLVAELPFIQKELETIGTAPLFGRSQVQTEGIGDVRFAMVVPFIRKYFESSQVHVGFDAPSGSYRRGGDDMRLPYDSQIGNGTWDFEWGWTYLGEYERVSWGGQFVGRHPIGRNGLRYREGLRLAGTLWGAVRIVSGLSASLRTEWVRHDNISGFDRTLRPSFDPSENAGNRGGDRFSVLPGVSFGLPQLSGQRIAVEVGIPVYQRLDGPQLERDWSIKMAWQWTF